MDKSSAWMAHGSFGIAPFDTYTLVTFSGSWNSICLKLFSENLEANRNVDSKRKRCSLVDGRNWGLLTPDSHEIFEEMSRFLSRDYASLDIAFIFNARNLKISRYILEKNKLNPEETMKWEYFQDLDEARLWLCAAGHNLPSLTWEDFPEPISLIKNQ